MNEDDIASLISEDDAKLMYRRIELKKSLSVIDKHLKSLDKNIKESMKDNEIKVVESHGMKLTYTPPRMYEDFGSKSFAIKVMKDIRPDLIEKKYGYARLTISKVKKK